MKPLWNRVAKRVNAPESGPGRCHRPPFAATVEKMTYRELQALLERMDTAVGAAEAHGWLCGALCVRADYGAPEWLGELAADAGGAARGDEYVPALGSLREDTLEALSSPEFTFMPLLPEDHAPLSERVPALAAWCGGFLYGIGTGAVGNAVTKMGDVGELLEDLADITRAEVGPGGDQERDEGDFAELVEFVRAGAQLAFEETAALRATAPGAGAAVH
jgi:uncharacterized protein YgfB (UPF0149 family)